jgi:kynurenine 3-monooxygenase
MSGSVRPLQVSIIGAGLGGALMAIYLARRGIDVKVFERRPDMRHGVVDHGRSINMTIAERGLASLQCVGLRERVMAITMPLKARLVHEESGRCSYQPYGHTPRQVHHALKRSELNCLLLDAASELPNVSTFFQRRYLQGGRDAGLFRLRNERTGESEYARADVLIGADGAHSCLRREMQRDRAADFQVEYLPEGYKELTIPAGPSRRHQLDPEALHVWPRGGCVLIAIPNLDGSFTCTFTMPFDGPLSYASLTTRDHIQRLFEQRFADVLAVVPQIVDDFISKPPARYLTTTTSPWRHEGRIVLLGDACHSVLPFYGQGMNAAFEDCRVLDDCLATHGTRLDLAFGDYEARRKPHTDALAQLSKENYLELKERIRSPVFQARRRIDRALERACPGVFATLYSLITHTVTPYGDAIAQCERRQRWMTRIGLGAVLRVAAICLAGLTLAWNWGRSRPPFSRVPAAPVSPPQSGQPVARGAYE